MFGRKPPVGESAVEAPSVDLARCCRRPASPAIRQPPACG